MEQKIMGEKKAFAADFITDKTIICSSQEFEIKFTSSILIKFLLWAAEPGPLESGPLSPRPSVSQSPGPWQHAHCLRLLSLINRKLISLQAKSLISLCCLESRKPQVFWAPLMAQ